MNTKKLLVLFSVVLMLFISACTTYRYEAEGPTGAVIDEEIDGSAELGEEGAESEGVVEEVEMPEEEMPEEAAPEEVAEETTEFVESNADVVAYEGDLIDLKPFVKDPDGDPIQLGYTSPFDENGEWQTGEGDAGFYSVIITATDGKDSFVTKQMTVQVIVLNQEPEFGIADVLEFNEGELIEIDPEIYDPDGDEVVVTYSGWMTSSKYQTSFEDAGEYVVTIKADDGVVRISKEVTVKVNDVNRKPVLKMLSEPRISVVEGSLVFVETEVSDPDGDEVVLTFSEPFDENGEWQTEAGDAGSYEVEVTLSDGSNEVTQEVLIEVMKKNVPPVIESFTVSPEYVVLKKPGDTVTVTLDAEATDVDGDELTYSYSGYMETDEMTIEYGMKGGVKTVTVTVSDGVDSVSQDVTFEINNWPCFDCLVS